MMGSSRLLIKWRLEKLCELGSQLECQDAYYEEGLWRSGKDLQEIQNLKSNPFKQVLAQI